MGIQVFQGYRFLVRILVACRRTMCYPSLCSARTGGSRRDQSRELTKGCREMKGGLLWVEVRESDDEQNDFNLAT